MLHIVFIMLIVACAMLVAHELGHVVVTRMLGGQWLGVERQGFLIGVQLSVDRLSTSQVALTLAAGPAAEILIVLICSLVAPQYYALWVLILAFQWIGNVIPWHVIPNDGTRLWQLWQHGIISTHRQPVKT